MPAPSPSTTPLSTAPGARLSTGRGLGGCWVCITLASVPAQRSRWPQRAAGSGLPEEGGCVHKREALSPMRPIPSHLAEGTAGPRLLRQRPARVTLPKAPLGSLPKTRESRRLTPRLPLSARSTGDPGPLASSTVKPSYFSITLAPPQPLRQGSLVSPALPDPWMAFPGMQGCKLVPKLLPFHHLAAVVSVPFTCPGFTGVLVRWQGREAPGKGAGLG